MRQYDKKRLEYSIPVNYMAVENKFEVWALSKTSYATGLSRVGVG
jgi:hypothetical protein